ncbi:DUF305 domain-containing protein [Streptomyces sp. TRM 70361]|uniref:DUF305 domain-containing protein n=1 Tax=Streptomyces sp. TRM 70361 TaxID=3116553 RepID=UPI002E7B2281|nr:DUF305 domain-containing protein [Streptomyces sp. TRM 70361]MEE1942930.1 DUF305 domain-containing protein [Streptomyces sp. TRM 70361]
MTAHHSALRRIAAAVTAVAAAAVLAACGGDRPAGDSGRDDRAAPGSSAPLPAGDHNAADVTFAQGMIPHHRQAVEMADLAGTRASAPEVKALAEQIKKAQDPEIETLSGWLESWGERVPAESDDGAGHGSHADRSGHSGHGDHGTTGMMTPGEMAGLEKSSGKAFDTAFLELMIRHHEGAVAMAEEERENGSHGPARSMAEDIITSQSAEIEKMNRLLGRE